MIDNRPLQTAAWAALQRARKKLEKATCEVHRHEETDEPAFRAWIAMTFPTLVSTLREIAQQVESNSRTIEAVERESFFTGRSPGAIWREWQQSGGVPPEPLFDPEEDNSDPPSDRSTAGTKAPFDEEMKKFFEDEGIDDDDPFGAAFRDIAGTLFGPGPERENPAKTEDARAIYRRLVQHLHPDRGGQWTPARARAWEQTQAAWGARDADWLARLEAEWEAGADLLGPGSALGRLRSALAAIEPARRDAERRLQTYRKHDAWRFSQQPPPASLRQRLEHQLRQDEWMLRRQLTETEALLARWTKVRVRRQRTRSRSSRFGT